MHHLVVSFFFGALTLGWLVICAAVLVWASRRVSAWERERPGCTGLFVVAPFVYFFSFQSALVSLLVGALLVRTPRLARQGRVSMAWAALFGTVQLFFAWALALAR